MEIVQLVFQFISDILLDLKDKIHRLRLDFVGGSCPIDDSDLKLVHHKKGS
jgi:hypothetical protein